jgi:class 3 adenylate cyclase
MEKQECRCVLFADVSGSTKLYETIGDARAQETIERCLAEMSRITAAEQGLVVKTIGDEIMSSFPDADAGARAAVAMQSTITALPVVGVRGLGLRVGLHFGPVVERDGDLFGDTVNLAARLTELAAKGQVITSLDTVERLSPLLKMDCRRLYSTAVKGKEKEVELCEILWNESGDATTMVADKRPAAAAATSLRLSYGGRVLRLPADRRSVVLGRDASADLVVADRMASRAHCEIELRADKFVVSDRSANGTYISEDGQNEVVLRREELVLRGHGYIVLGQSRAGATELVEYTCE